MSSGISPRSFRIKHVHNFPKTFWIRVLPRASKLSLISVDSKCKNSHNYFSNRQRSICYLCIVNLCHSPTYTKATQPRRLLFLFIYIVFSCDLLSHLFAEKKRIQLTNEIFFTFLSLFLLQAIYDMLGACSSNKPADSAEERAKNIFAKMDENNDGQLTQDEFLKGCLQDEELSKMLAP